MRLNPAMVTKAPIIAASFLLIEVLLKCVGQKNYFRAIHPAKQKNPPMPHGH
jgi:hypothetical protein